MMRQLSLNDGILLASLLYSCMDLQMEWASFSTCNQPVHWWLLVSYGSVIAFRLTHILGAQLAGRRSDGEPVIDAEQGIGEFLLDLRHKGTLPRMLVTFTWAVALPFFTLWTLLGTKWFWDVAHRSPQCMPTSTHLWFSAFWLLLCYVWIGVHVALGGVAWTLESRVQRAEGSLRAIEDEDVRRRWGHVSNLDGYRDVNGAEPTAGRGLAPSDIKLLPEFHVPQDLSCAQRECSICLTDFEPGDRARQLPSCGHTFHCSCIDLWLLRSADCPLCKRSVSRSGAGSGTWV